MEESHNGQISLGETLFMGNCPKCGAVNYGPHSSCLLCQSPLPLGDTIIPVSQTCPQCNQVLDTGKKFCTNCGADLSASSK